MSDRTQTLLVELGPHEAEALRHELSEPYGHEIRAGILGKLRSLLFQPEQGHVCDPEHPCEPNDHLCRNHHPGSQPEHQGDERERLLNIATGLSLSSKEPGDWWECAAADLRTLASQEHRGEEEQDYLERYERACKRADSALDLAEGYRVVLERIATETKVTDINGEYEKTTPLDASECRNLAREAIRNPQRVQPPAGEEELRAILDALHAAGIVNGEEVEADAADLVAAIAEWQATQSPTPRGGGFQERLHTIARRIEDSGWRTSAAELRDIAGEEERLRERLADEDLNCDLAHRLEDGSGFDLTFEEAADWAHSLLTWLGDELLGRPSDSQGDQERCGGGGKLAHVMSSPGGNPFGPPRDCPGCPDCNPAPTQADYLDDADEALAEAEQPEGGDDDAPKPGWLGRAFENAHRNMAARPEHLRPEGYEVPGGDEEDWPEVWVSRTNPAADPEGYEVWHKDNRPGDEEATETRRYLPATSQDSSWLEEANREHTRLVKRGNEQEDRALKAETALEELATEFESMAAKRDREGQGRTDPNGCGAGWLREAAKRTREKAAKLKGEHDV